VKLPEYAKLNGISYKTAWKAFKEGRIKNARQLPSGTIIIDEDPRNERFEVNLEKLEELIEKLLNRLEESGK
jgi:predicted site-specific integrase-resolvase